MDRRWKGRGLGLNDLEMGFGDLLRSMNINHLCGRPPFDASLGFICLFFLLLMFLLLMNM